MSNGAQKIRTFIQEFNDVVGLLQGIQQGREEGEQLVEHLKQRNPQTLEASLMRVVAYWPASQGGGKPLILSGEVAPPAMPITLQIVFRDAIPFCLAN